MQGLWRKPAGGRAIILRYCTLRTSASKQAPAKTSRNRTKMAAILLFIYRLHYGLKRGRLGSSGRWLIRSRRKGRRSRRPSNSGVYSSQSPSSVSVMRRGSRESMPSRMSAPRWPRQSRQAESAREAERVRRRIRSAQISGRESFVSSCPYWNSFPKNVRYKPVT